MVGGLEVGLALRLGRLRSVAGLAASRKRISGRQRHHLQAEDIFFDTGSVERGHRNCVNELHVHQSTGELVAYRSFLAGTYSSDDRRSLDQLLRKRVPDHRPDTRASLIVTLLLSLGLCAGIWGALSSLALVVLR